MDQPQQPRGDFHAPVSRCKQPGDDNRPGQIVLFPNKFKAEAPDRERPDLWGWANRSDGTPPFRPGV